MAEAVTSLFGGHIDRPADYWQTLAMRRRSTKKTTEIERQIASLANRVDVLERHNLDIMQHLIRLRGVNPTSARLRIVGSEAEQETPPPSAQIITLPTPRTSKPMRKHTRH
jgi:hypothetical protein